jgi:aspartyl-tRNA(Asn)/glutamyl-tRNA(Gln) amidotransferase subunit A
MKDLHKLTIKEASSKLERGEISSLEITNSVLKRIEQVEPQVGAYITVTKELALKRAKESDARREKGKALSRIDGIPIAVKDLFNTKGVKTTAASKILEDFVPQYESSVTQKLWDAGAVLIGKTNLDQFAMGSSTESSAFKTTKNPWDLSRVPGGSSGGSAAAVAADMCIAALGTDTGGSIRQPASLCGIVGLKPTYGRVSRYGVNAMASSLDTIGPMTKTVEDAAILLNIIAGQDKYDSTTLPSEVPNYLDSLGKDIKNLKIGIPKEFYGEGMVGEVDEIVKNAINVFKSQGIQISEVSLPSVKYALDVYYIIVWAEVASNMARYDGIRYGHSKIKNQKLVSRNSEGSKIKNLEDVYITSRTEGLGDEVKRRIMLGNYVLSSGYYDAYYKKAQQVRTLVKKDFENVFKKVDILLTPVSPTAAFKIGEKTDDPLQMYLSDIHTVPINPAGVPAISIPAGFTKNNLPVGIQLIAPQCGEETIFRVADWFERNAKVNKQKPAI